MPPIYVRQAGEATDATFGRKHRAERTPPARLAKANRNAARCSLSIIKNATGFSFGNINIDTDIANQGAPFARPANHGPNLNALTSRLLSTDTAGIPRRQR